MMDFHQKSDHIQVLFQLFCLYCILNTYLFSNIDFTFMKKTTSIVAFCT